MTATTAPVKSFDSLQAGAVEVRVTSKRKRKATLTQATMIRTLINIRPISPEALVVVVHAGRSDYPTSRTPQRDPSATAHGDFLWTTSVSGRLARCLDVNRFVGLRVMGMICTKYPVDHGFSV